MKVDAIRRYPVKAMAGESLESVRVDERGLEGDRWYAVWDGDDRMATGKDSRRFRRRDEIFEFRARTTAEGVRVEGRGGAWLAGESSLDDSLGAHMGANVRVVPEAAVSHQDAGQVSLVGTASLAWCREHLDVDGDARRLRVNLVVETQEPFEEETWRGRVRIGQVDLSVVERIERCRMIDIAQEDLSAQPGWLKALGRERDLSLGIYLDVVTTGWIETGDRVEASLG